MATLLSFVWRTVTKGIAVGFLAVLSLSVVGLETVSDAGYRCEEPMIGMASNLHPDLVIVLHKIEDRLKRQLNVTSGYRGPTHNHDVGGVENSEHTYDPAQAVDVECNNGSECWQIVNAALAEGIVRLGVGRNFVHIGIAKDKPQHVIWNYYPKPKSDAQTT